ncbi:hypothetical protein [Clostridium sp.]|jgi:hypothetical protein|uniref:hypothetical protein n=1 Tax=Clostridium sp. TaxID=1506 RepID=UPI003EEEE1A6
MTMVLFSGCSSKEVDTSATTTDTTSVTQDTKKNDPEEMKTTYSNVLKALVTDNTITQVQSDKVLEVVVKQPAAGAPSKDATASTDGTTSTDGKQKQPQNIRLSELVTSEVITQAQADTIDQQVKEANKIAKDATTK